MHVDAVRAAVDLRHAQLDQVEQLRVEPALAQISFQPQHSPERAGIDRCDFDSWLHDELPFVLFERKPETHRSQFSQESWKSSLGSTARKPTCSANQECRLH